MMIGNWDNFLGEVCFFAYGVIEDLVYAVVITEKLSILGMLSFWLSILSRT